MIVAISWVRDEADIVGDIVGHMVDQCDRVIVADHGSTDGTRDILADLPITVIDDPVPTFHQSQIMSELAQWAVDDGADLIVPFDADELWGGLDQFVVRPGVWSVPVYDHVPTSLDDPTLGPILRQQWRQRDPAIARKVMFTPQRLNRLSTGNHSVDGDFGQPADGVSIRHYPNRSIEQFVAKIERGAETYDPGNLDDGWYGAHWKRMRPRAAEVFTETFHHDDPATNPMLVEDGVKAAGSA